MASALLGERRVCMELAEYVCFLFISCQVDVYQYLMKSVGAQLTFFGIVCHMSHLLLAPYLIMLWTLLELFSGLGRNVLLAYAYDDIIVHLVVYLLVLWREY